MRGITLRGKEPKMEVHYTDLDKDTVNDLEYEWIKLFKQTGNLLNRSDGGATNSGWNHSEEQKEKWRRERRGEKAPNYGLKKSEEEKRKSSERMKEHYKTNKHHMLGKKHSAETREKIKRNRGTPKLTKKGKAAQAAARKRNWENPEYREKMLRVMERTNASGCNRGLKSGRSSLSLKDVWNIYMASWTSLSNMKVAEMYNASASTVNFIKHKKAYRDELDGIAKVVLLDY